MKNFMDTLPNYIAALNFMTHNQEGDKQHPADAIKWLKGQFRNLKKDECNQIVSIWISQE